MSWGRRELFCDYISLFLGWKFNTKSVKILLNCYHRVVVKPRVEGHRQICVTSFMIDPLPGALVNGVSLALGSAPGVGAIVSVLLLCVGGNDGGNQDN